MNAVAALCRSIEQQDFAEYRGRITRIDATRLEATGPLSRPGDYCEIQSGTGPASLAEVVGVEAGRIRLMPLTPNAPIHLGSQVKRSQRFSSFIVGEGLARRAIDALGRAIDGLPEPADTRQVDRQRVAPSALDRITPTRIIATGIRVIDAVLPIGEGQRIGIFAASGVGKTSLVEQLSQQISCDHVVLCLVGERGREVEALWSVHKDRTAGPPTTIVAATSDESPSMRVRAVEQALAICENWRAAGKHVLLFIDSITRLALALRELGLAAGEPPALRALTPNVFTYMPQLVERCGAMRSGGAITGVFTVLSETDDVDDPIVELMKSLLDGHIILSRRLAERGHFPAIDPIASVSRLASRLLTREGLSAARRAQGILADYEEARPMIESGIYRSGSSMAIDEAIARMPGLNIFLRQHDREYTDPATAVSTLGGLLGAGVANG